MKRFSCSQVCYAATLTAIAALYASQAFAASGKEFEYQYKACDGYGPAAEYGDGMIEVGQSNLSRIGRKILFVKLPRVERATPAIGRPAITACDAVLGILPEKHWQRRVSLLRERAIHKVEVGDAPGALADLDLAQAAVKDNADPFYARALGLGLELVRAHALVVSRDKQKGEALALETLSQRPYNRQIPGSALFAIGENPSDAAFDTGVRAAARLSPALVDTLYIRAFNTRRYSDAIDLFSQISPPHELGNLNISAAEAEEREWRNYEIAEVYWAARTSFYAYALAATGRSNDAREALDMARTRLEKDTQPPPALDRSKAKDRTAVALQKGLADIHARAAVEGKKIFDLWAPIVDLRIMVTEGKTDDVLTAIRINPLPLNSATQELVAAASAAAQSPGAGPPKPTLIVPVAPPPADGSTSARSPAAGPQKPPAPVVTAPNTVPARLAASLPEAETAEEVPRFAKQETFWFTNNPNPRDDGYFVGKPNAEGVTTFSFRGADATQTMVEELALLGAADVARKSGKKGMIVVDRRDIKYRAVATYYGTPVSNTADGSGTQLDIVFVDPAALPEKYKMGAWRVIDADAVYSALAPIYLKQKSK